MNWITPGTWSVVKSHAVDMHDEKHVVKKIWFRMLVLYRR